MSKRFIEKIVNVSLELSKSQPDLSRYECLEKATQQITNNTNHFSELAPIYQNHLLGRMPGIDAHLKRKARGIVKEQEIPYAMARRQVKAELGIVDDRDVKLRAKHNNDSESNRLAMLRKLTGRALVTTLIEYLSLPQLDAEEVKRREPEQLIVKHFDYLKAPLKACGQQSIESYYEVDGEALFPIAVVKEKDGKLKDYQLAPEEMEWVKSVIDASAFENVEFVVKRNGDNFDFIKAKLFD
jgi:hypothetical protein